MITIYRNLKETLSPKYITIEQALQRIKSCHSQQQVDKVRKAQKALNDERDSK